jgi:hypothetical protein
MKQEDLNIDFMLCLFLLDSVHFYIRWSYFLWVNEIYYFTTLSISIFLKRMFLFHAVNDTSKL